MRSALVLVIALLVQIGCASPKNDPSPQMIDTDFSQIKILLQPPAPPYPPEAKIGGIQGTVVVVLTIGVDGIPISANAVEGPTQLRPTAEAYALKWKFAPCLLNGVPRGARFKLTMPFRLNNLQPNAETRKQEDLAQIIGDWEGVDSRGIKGSWHFLADGYAQIAVDGLGVLPTKYKGASLKYSVDKSKSPTWLDLIIFDESGKERGRIRLIIQLLSPTEMKMGETTKNPSIRPENWNTSNATSILMLKKIKENRS